jgi:predicted nucleotidyltransferase component of viral defense system
MRGGTVLHKGHLAPASRYSEDIDLVRVGDRPPAHIKKALTRVLIPILGEPSESVFTTITLAVRNLAMKSRIIRSTYLYDPSSSTGALAELKIEVNVNETQSLYPLVPIAIDVPHDEGGTRPLAVRSYDLDEMLGTKMRALLQREHGRDLFDLWWAWEHSKGMPVPIVNPARVGAAFRFYMDREGSPFSAAYYGLELARRMQSPKFLRDMEGYVPVGRTYDPHLAYREFCEVFLPHINSSTTNAD